MTCGFGRTGRQSDRWESPSLKARVSPPPQSEWMRSESDVLKSCRTAPHTVKAFPSAWQANRMPDTRLPGLQRDAGPSPSLAANPQVKHMIAVSDPYTVLAVSKDCGRRADDDERRAGHRRRTGSPLGRGDEGFRLSRTVACLARVSRGSFMKTTDGRWGTSCLRNANGLR